MTRNPLTSFRGRSLLLVAMIAGGYGYNLAHPSVTLGAHQSAHVSYAFEVASAHTWGIVWLAVAVVVFLGSFSRRDAIPFAAATALLLGWAALFMGAWFGGHGLFRPWLNAVMFGALGLKTLNSSAWPDER